MSNSPAKLPTLESAARRVETARERIAEAARIFDRNTLAARVSVGVAALAAQERHALPSGKRGQGRKSVARRANDSGSGKEKSVLRRRSDSAPEGFLQWIAENIPWLARRTVYNYMDAALGAGLNAWSTEEEIDTVIATKLAEHDDKLNLAALMDAAKAIPFLEDAEPGGGDDEPQEEFPFAAMLDAQACIGGPVAGLAATIKNPEKFSRYIHDLPLEDLEADESIGRPAITGLITLRATLATAYGEIDQAVKDKRAGKSKS